MGGATGWSRTSKESRGYGAEWAAKRRRVLHRDGYRCRCERCRESGALRVATEVDHVISRAEAARRGWSRERTESEDNLQAINGDCHREKTMLERGARPKARRPVGPDGFPL